MKIQKEKLKKEIEKQLKITYGKEIQDAEDFEIYQSLGKVIMSEISENWYKTTESYKEKKQAF
ncbi:MAG: hypothetical protein RR656_05075, partial [Cetobacterium sp.]